MTVRKISAFSSPPAFEVFILQFNESSPLFNGVLSKFNNIKMSSLGRSWQMSRNLNSDSLFSYLDRTVMTHSTMCVHTCAYVCVCSPPFRVCVCVLQVFVCVIACICRWYNLRFYLVLCRAFRSLSRPRRRNASRFRQRRGAIDVNLNKRQTYMDVFPLKIRIIWMSLSLPMVVKQIVLVKLCYCPWKS